MKLAVIIPTLNEEEALSRHLPLLARPADEIIVSDGGSVDATVAVAESSGARVVIGPPGRGGQLNRGAQEARAEVLLFLHADTTLPAGGLDAVRRAVDQGFVGGGFGVRFDADTRMLRLTKRLINLRTRLTRAPLGDQAQFATRTAFERVGGFEDWPILEDLDFIRRLRKAGRLAILEPAVTTAARRFQQRGHLRTVSTNWLIWTLFLAGIPPHRLARLYQQVR